MKKWPRWLPAVFINLHKSHRWFVFSFPLWEMGKNRYVLNMSCKPYLNIAVAGSSLYTVYVVITVVVRVG